MTLSDTSDSVVGKCIYCFEAFLNLFIKLMGTGLAGMFGVLSCPRGQSEKLRISLFLGFFPDLCETIKLKMKAK